MRAGVAACRAPHYAEPPTAAQLQKDESKRTTSTRDQALAEFGVVGAAPAAANIEVLIGGGPG